MTDPKLATTYDWGRMYARTRGGEPAVPSITTVLDVLNQHMEWWEAFCATRLAMEHAPRLASILEMPQGPPRWSRARAATDWLMAAAERDRDDAAARGDVVHNYAEVFALHHMGQASADDVAEHEQLCADAGVSDYITHFHQWWRDWNPRPIQPEATVWNSTVGYAGTTDLIFEMEIGGRTAQVIGDYKTKRSLYKKNGDRKEKDLREDTAMQLAAAARAEEVWVPGVTADEDQWHRFPYAPQAAVGIGLAPDGYVARQYDITDPLVWASFVALRQVWPWQKDGPALMSDPLFGPSDLRLHDCAAVVGAL